MKCCATKQKQMKNDFNIYSIVLVKGWSHLYFDKSNIYLFKITTFGGALYCVKSFRPFVCVSALSTHFLYDLFLLGFFSSTTAWLWKMLTKSMRWVWALDLTRAWQLKTLHWILFLLRISANYVRWVDHTWFCNIVCNSNKLCSRLHSFDWMGENWLLISNVPFCYKRIQRSAQLNSRNRRNDKFEIK